MTALWPLHGVVRHYAWGSRHFIPDLLGEPNPGDTPWAELWMGAHPSAPSTVSISGEGEVELDALLAREPEALLGDTVAHRFGARLPFLFKVLAAAEPLSIQAHPSLEQARAGFARENAAGIPLDASHRNYRDDNHKPELIVALTPFVALEGFRPPAEIAHRITALGLTDLQTQASTLATTSDLQPFFAAVMTLSEGARRRVLRQLRLAVTSEPGLQAHWIRILLDRHPDDIGALAPVLLHVVVLRPGQALFLPAGELHAYLEGAGLELMANSDNVLRGGLTPKHIDVPELLRILRFEPSAPAILEPQPGSAGCFVYSTPASEFELAYVDATREPVALPGTAGSIRVALCTEGSVELLAAGDPPLVLERGRCAMVSGRAADPQICGTGRVWLAGVP